MKRYFYCFLVLIAMVMTSCFGGGDPTYQSSDLIGTWHGASEVEPSSKNLIYAFQEDGWGYTYDEGDDISYEDLQYHGNGWFTWTLSGKTIKTINKMDNEAADVPINYTISQLTSSKLVMSQGMKNYTLTKQ